MKRLIILFFLIANVHAHAKPEEEDSQLSIKFKRFSESFLDLTAEIGKELKTKGAEVKDKASSEWKPKIQKEIATLREKLDELVKQLEEESPEKSKRASN